MNFPSDTIQGSPTVHTKVEKQPDGTFKATPQIQGVAASVGRTEQEAIQKNRAALEAWFGGGGKGESTR